LTSVPICQIVIFINHPMVTPGGAAEKGGAQ
jgi:hypothetical protein